MKCGKFRTWYALLQGLICTNVVFWGGTYVQVVALFSSFRLVETSHPGKKNMPWMDLHKGSYDLSVCFDFAALKDCGVS